MLPSAHPRVHGWLQQETSAIQQAFQADPWQTAAPFVALYERYADPLLALASDRIVAPTQADWAVAQAWQQLWQALQQAETTWDWPDYQSFAECYWKDLWLPPTEAIAYDLISMPPPLWVYTQVAIAQLPGIDRLLLTLTYTYRWSRSQVLDQLQMLGHRLGEPQLQQLLEIVEVRLLAALPPDLLDIYGDWSYPALPPTTRSPL
ncbi:hypothetical protein [Synechococcus elongatus]|uniref:Sigma-70 family RNA polymerase sigma factor n=1 Tax=Synechococcus elongatus PCC 11802 TaxID=2283154 RepID=A0AAT9JUN8_SYNEL|nr:hypothetical protein [Synechococcus elongatus]QFZ92650.1 hypothetical protein EKO22_10155 [Synechococcus elongatus PCC 11802]